MWRQWSGTHVIFLETVTRHTGDNMVTVTRYTGDIFGDSDQAHRWQFGDSDQVHRWYFWRQWPGTQVTIWWQWPGTQVIFLEIVTRHTLDNLVTMIRDKGEIFGDICQAHRWVKLSTLTATRQLGEWDYYCVSDGARKWVTIFVEIPHKLKVAKFPHPNTIQNAPPAIHSPRILERSWSFYSIES
jgi:hypothetical protein